MTGGENLPRQGYWTELRFMAEAARRGFSVMRPWCRESACDVAIDLGHSFLRIQVKSSAKRCHSNRPYRKTPPIVYSFCTRRRGGKAYRASDFQFYALYIIPRNLWYIVPHDAVGQVTHLLVYPDVPTHRLQPYREAWHLLREYGSGELTIQACAEEEIAEVGDL